MKLGIVKKLALQYILEFLNELVLHLHDRNENRNVDA